MFVRLILWRLLVLDFCLLGIFLFYFALFGKGNGNSLLVLLPGKSHGWRSLVGYSPWGHKELDTTEWLNFLFFANLVSLLMIDLFRLSFSSSSALEDCMFLGIYPFLLGCWICWHIIVCSILFSYWICLVHWVLVAARRVFISSCRISHCGLWTF